MTSADVTARLRAAGCVFAEDEARLLIDAAATSDQLADLVARRVAGEPLEHVVGWVAFGGLRIAVEPGVFVPRRRTELVVEQALAVARPDAVVVELCCGAAAVSAAILAARPDVTVLAADVDPVAVRCARHNLGRRAAVYRGDLFEALPVALRGCVDVLVANAPYVPSDEIATMPVEARVHEPRLALDGGADGLDVQRRIVSEASRWLRPGGRLLIETSRRQAAGSVALAEDAGLVARVVRDDDRDATALLAELPPAPR